jgi:hypothetical protein
MFTEFAANELVMSKVFEAHDRRLRREPWILMCAAGCLEVYGSNTG